MLYLNKEDFLDLKYLASGVLDPLCGFMNHDEFKSVAYECRLPSKELWTLPITLAVDEKSFHIGQSVDLYFKNELVGKMKIRDKFKVCKEDFFEIFACKNDKHPGLLKELKKSQTRIGGEVELKDEILKGVLYKNILQDLFKDINPSVKTICGFQTRNPIHKAHEHLQRIALEFCDALFINPIIGWKKSGDFTTEVVFKAYETMIKLFYPSDRVILKGLETAMRYAGPKEAIFHAILRRNLGCSHFIIGRDHAGVGDFYGIYDAHKLAKELNANDELDIELLLLKEPYYCKTCEQIVSDKHCSHYETQRIAISATQIRKDLSENKIPNSSMMRKEIADAILAFGKDKIFIKE